jgi:hypothetical protein
MTHKVGWDPRISGHNSITGDSSWSVPEGFVGDAGGFGYGRHTVSGDGVSAAGGT